MRFSRSAIRAALSSSDSISAAAYMLGTEHRILSNYIRRCNCLIIKRLAASCIKREPVADQIRRRKPAAE